MGNYITSTDLIQGLSNKEQAQLTGDLNEATAIADIADWAIDSAESLIDTHISAQVSVPLETPTPLIKNMAMAIAKYYLFLRRHVVPEDINREQDRIMKLLDKMLTGELPIDLTDPARPTVDYGSDGRLFNEYVGS